MELRSTPVLVTAYRTPIGRYLGGLSGKTAIELGAIAANKVLDLPGLDRGAVQEAIVGCVLPAGLGQAPARQIALKAGMSAQASALTVNMVCGSGLRAIMLAATAIRTQDADLILAGGIESMSNAPHLLQGGRGGWKFGDATLIDSMLRDGLTCAIAEWPMGMAAERTAEQCGLTREGLDRYSLGSHQKAIAAQKAGAFRDEIVPVILKSKKGDTVIAVDESPRADSTLEGLAKLPLAFKTDGIVTAGNASTLSDGAAMTLIASEAKANELGVKPLARIQAWATAGLDPRDLFLAPVNAVRTAVSKAGLTLDQIDLFEINEAFASQMLGCIQQLEIDPAKVNIRGGAIALGHPIGASGARVLTTLAHALRQTGQRQGVAALCLGGGNAVAMVIESC